MDSSYIANLPEAEYRILEDGSLGENGVDKLISAKKGTLFLLLSQLADKITGGKRGQIFTIAINSAGYSTSPDKLNHVYEQNSKAIDAYFNEIDMVKLARAIGGDAEDAMMTGSTEWVKKRLPAFGLGVGLAALGLLILR